VPDIRGRVVAGQDDMGGSSANRLTGQTGGLNGDILGGTGGSQTHTLTEAQMPAHRHLIFSNNTASGTFGNSNLNSSNSAARQNNGLGEGDEKYSMMNGSADASVGRSQQKGSSQAHNNVQPTIILNYIIKT
jgi:microcystin-dependent protein